MRRRILAIPNMATSEDKPIRPHSDKVGMLEGEGTGGGEPMTTVELSALAPAPNVQTYVPLVNPMPARVWAFQVAVHRVPPQLMGMLPNNLGGFGDVEKAAKVFARNEIAPLQATMAHAINTWTGVPACAFRPCVLEDAPKAVKWQTISVTVESL